MTSTCPDCDAILGSYVLPDNPRTAGSPLGRSMTHPILVTCLHGHEHEAEGMQLTPDGYAFALRAP